MAPAGKPFVIALEEHYYDPNWRRPLTVQKVERRKSVAGWMTSASFASRRWTRRGSMSR